MTFLAHPTHYTRDEFRALIAGVKIGAWTPAFPTLHNTGTPSLAQWKSYGATPQERWGASLNHYYQNQLGWHSGPHFVCCPDYIWHLCDLAADGVSVSCWNHLTLGVEMVGNFEVGGDDFSSGDGAKVRGNAAFTLAVLCEKFGWDPERYETGHSGLHFHHECARDGHPCPGSKVVKPDMIERVKAVLGALKANPLPAPPPTKIPAGYAIPGAMQTAAEVFSVEDIQSALDRLGAEPALAVNGVYDAATQAAVKRFQAAHGCDADGWVGPQTTAALKAALGAALGAG